MACLSRHDRLSTSTLHDRHNLLIHAMALTRARSGRVESLGLDMPVAGREQVVVRVLACGVCRTDLHVVDGDLTEPVIPVVPRHEIVGRVEQIGCGVARFALGDLVGIPRLGTTCGVCEFCIGRSVGPIDTVIARLKAVASRVGPLAAPDQSR
jgi:Zn-dependent alcohol dehydrogenase